MKKILVEILLSFLLTSCSSGYIYKFGINVNKHPQYFAKNYSSLNTDRIHKNHCDLTSIRLPGSDKVSIYVNHLQLTDWGYRDKYPEINGSFFLITSINTFSEDIISIKVINKIDEEPLIPISKYFTFYDSTKQTESERKVIEYEDVNRQKPWGILEFYKFPKSKWFYHTHSKKNWFNNIVQIIEVKFYSDSGVIETITYKFDLNWYPYQSEFEALWYI